jgi:predicted nucleotidyltransferase
MHRIICLSVLYWNKIAQIDEGVTTLSLLTDEHTQIIVQQVSQKLAAHTIILFGSAARGKLRDDSDLDIAYLADTHHTAYERFMVASELANQLSREVDLVDFAEASTVFKAQIIGGGKVLLDERPIDRQYIYMRALKDYAMLNEERRPILEKLFYTGGYRDESGHHREQN